MQQKYSFWYSKRCSEHCLYLSVLQCGVCKILHQQGHDDMRDVMTSHDVTWRHYWFTRKWHFFGHISCKWCMQYYTYLSVLQCGVCKILHQQGHDMRDVMTSHDVTWRHYWFTRKDTFFSIFLVNDAFNTIHTFLFCSVTCVRFCTSKDTTCVMS